MPANDILLESFGRNSDDWNITEAVYQGGGQNGQAVTFLVFESKQQWGGSVGRIQDTGGRRKAVLEFPYTDGQTLDDLGRKGETFEMEIVFFGPGYRNGLNSLLQQVDIPQPGLLLHPVRGSVTCALIDYTLEFSEGQRNAVLMRARFSEHNFDAVSLSITPVVKSIPAVMAGAVTVLQGLGSVVVAIKNAIKLVQSVKSELAQTTQGYINQFQSFLADVNSLTSPAVGDNNGYQFPGIAPVNTGGQLQTISAAVSTNSQAASTSATAGVGGVATLPGGYVLVGQRNPTVVAPTDPFANIDPSLLNPTTAAAITVTKLGQEVQTLRAAGQALIASMEAANSGAGSTQMRDLILVIIQSAISAQQVLEAVQASSSAQLVTYVVPTNKVMSIREVAFANGLTPDDAADILVLNPSLESTNYIPGGTSLQVARPT
jgi:prophage DNA circulation protein